MDRQLSKQALNNGLQVSHDRRSPDGPPPRSAIIAELNCRQTSRAKPPERLSISSSAPACWKRAGGSLPVWRRDDDSGAMALRITKNGLEAIDVVDEATAAPKETSVHPAPAREGESPAPKAVAFRKQISVAAQKSAH